MGTAGKMETGESKAIATENLKEERKYQGNKINMNELMIATK